MAPFTLDPLAPSWSVQWREDLKLRRDRLMAAIGSGVAIFRSAPPAVMHNDVEYGYRQDSDFYYVTGFDEPEAVAVLAPNHPDHAYVLFVRPKDRLAETWSGRRLGVEGALMELGADAVYGIDELEDHLAAYLETGDRLFYGLGRDRAFDELLLGQWRSLLRRRQKTGKGPIAIEDPSGRLHQLRNRKTEPELALMRRAIAIAAEAHQTAIELTRPGVWEYEIQAEMERIFRRHGGWGPAYPSIVASGDNACILHYVENSRQMRDGDLLLIDAGCSYRYYNSDITRTFPVNGRFSAPQRALYELVLESQVQAIAQVKPGNTYKTMHDTAVQVLTEGLVALGLLAGDPAELIERKIYRSFYMHGTGHWLGLDVHDVGLYHNGEADEPFQPGQVITVEPGLYIAPDAEPMQPPELDGDDEDATDDDWPEQPPIDDRWRGLGIRIEDNVLVTENGCEVLTAAVPKAITDLEH